MYSSRVRPFVAISFLLTCPDPVCDKNHRASSTYFGVVGPNLISFPGPTAESETKLDASGTADPPVVRQKPTGLHDFFVLAFPRCLAPFVVRAQEQNELVPVGVEE